MEEKVVKRNRVLDFSVDDQTKGVSLVENLANKFSLVHSSFFQIRRNFELIFRFMSSQLRKFERRFFFIMNTRNRSFVSGIKYMCLYVRA